MSSRNDHSVGYDHTLLSSVPDPTRAEKQEGYNVDLLEDGRDGRLPNGASPPAVSDYGGGTTLDHSPGPNVAIDSASKAPYGTAAQKVQPWYRRKWGIIGIAIVALLIIAGAVGGAVGGTHHNNSHSHSGSTNSNGTVSTGNSSTGSNGTNPNGSNGTGSSGNSTNGVQQGSG